MDRLRDAWNRAVRSAFSRIDYYALYRAKVVSQNGQKVDVAPDDPRIPGLKNVPLRHGMPGLEATVAPGCYLLLGWDGGDPSKCYATLWDGGESVSKLVLKAVAVYLAAEPGAMKVALAPLVKAEMDAFAAAHSNHVHGVTVSGAGTYTTDPPATYTVTGNMAAQKTNAF